MASTNLVRLPAPDPTPLASIGRRIGMASALVLFVALVVRLGRNGYVDINNDPISFLDAIYYASVTVTTTGYGDISAVSPSARLGTILLITPARILFLILVVSTTVEVLTEQSRELLAERRWRQRVNNHTIICGFGSTGQAAADDLMSRGVAPEDVVVVDVDPKRVEFATTMGFAGIVGDAASTHVLHQAGIDKAAKIIVSPNRDDTAVLVTLTSRELSPSAHIVAGVRERENIHLFEQGGANEVVDATAAVGRMLGLGTQHPGAGRVLEDLLDAGDGLELVETVPDNSGESPCAPNGATLVAIIRDGKRLPPAEANRATLQASDRLVVLRETQ